LWSFTGTIVYMKLASTNIILEIGGWNDRQANVQMERWKECKQSCVNVPMERWKECKQSCVNVPMEGV